MSRRRRAAAPSSASSDAVPLWQVSLWRHPAASRRNAGSRAMVALKSDFRRVVVTGVGVVSPVGIGKDAFWQNLLAGHSGIGFLRAFANERLPCRLAAEVADFNPLNYLRQRKLLKVMSRDIQLGVGAAALAMSDARLA